MLWNDSKKNNMNEHIKELKKRAKQGDNDAIDELDLMGQL